MAKLGDPVRVFAQGCDAGESTPGPGSGAAGRLLYPRSPRHAPATPAARGAGAFPAVCRFRDCAVGPRVDLACISRRTVPEPRRRALRSIRYGAPFARWFAPLTEVDRAMSGMGNYGASIRLLRRNGQRSLREIAGLCELKSRAHVAFHRTRRLLGRCRDDFRDKFWHSADDSGMMSESSAH